MSAAALADELIEAAAAARAVSPFTSRGAFDFTQAYEVADRVHRARIARGERPVGRKIGFTNRNIWPEYGVYEPIWGYVYDSTLTTARGDRAELALAGLAEPRIEPEIVLHFRTAPPVSRDEQALLDCIDWIAHGIEIVQSPFPGWRFAVQDTIAANGLHGVLVIGTPMPIGDIADCGRKLREFRIALSRGGAVQAEGAGANVLDSPLLAFAHLADVLARLPVSPVGAGEVVTTGTLTSALPVKPGETWSTRLDGIPLPGLTIAFR